jgi:hypothetical protein
LQQNPASAPNHHRLALAAFIGIGGALDDAEPVPVNLGYEFVGVALPGLLIVGADLDVDLLALAVGEEVHQVGEG